MNLKAINIIEAMERWVPNDLVDSWDNTGFQIGDPNREIEKILIALDLDELVLNWAISDGYQMIITHHPIIYRPLTSLAITNHTSSTIHKAIKNDLVVYNAHSNLDLVPGGVNDRLANILGVRNTIPLSPISKLDNLGRELGYGRIGEIDELSFIEFINLIKEKLNVSELLVYGDTSKTISRVAVCGGSGGSFVLDAFNKGADIYITGDIKYHDSQLGYELGLTLVDAGHYNTEKVVLPAIKEYLESELGNQLKIEVLMESHVPRYIY
ncbi:MAG: Nif3-like dinuclear metal center hexameric protein [Tissierellaceae bacterium]